MSRLGGSARGGLVVLSTALVMTIAAGAIALVSGVLPPGDATSAEDQATRATDTSSTDGTPGTADAADTDAATSAAPLLTAHEADFVEDGRFLETFDGRPDAPEPFSSAAWSINFSSRDPDTWEHLEAMQAHHGPGCEAPMATHEVTEYHRAVYTCADHVMTAVNASGYAVLYLTPHALVDFSAGEAVVRFDVSTFRSSGRDWIDLWVTAFDDQLALPFNPDEGDVDLQGAPLNAVHVEMDRGCSGFRLTWYQDGESFSDSPGCWGLPTWYEVLTPDARRRDTLELQISRTSVRLWMPDYGFTLASAGPGDGFDLGFEVGVVQLGHHSYNPHKDCHTANSSMDAEDCGPTTWHWDNVELAPARPVPVTGAEMRLVMEDGAQVDFRHRAPRGAHLRFSAVGRVDVSFDGGDMWRAAAKQATVLKGPYHPEHASSYWTPVPEGASSVQFRFSPDEWYQGPFHARDFSLWSSVAPQEVAAP